MKKFFIIMLLSITLLMAVFGGQLAFAQETANESAEVLDTQSNKVAENIRIISIYAIFILSLTVGIPILKRMNRRSKLTNSESLSTLTKKEAERLGELILADKRVSSKDIIREAFYLNVLAEKVLSVYTLEQIDGYFDVYKSILQVREMLLKLEKKRGNDYNDFAKEIAENMESITNQVDFIIEREKKINQYNG